ncbi:hypothetical protein CG403_06215, partial [Gardnerella vaginalis]
MFFSYEIIVYLFLCALIFAMISASPNVKIVEKAVSDIALPVFGSWLLSFLRFSTILLFGFSFGSGVMFGVFSGVGLYFGHGVFSGVCFGV